MRAQTPDCRSSPENVYSRSRRCDLDWPEYREISSEERDFPLAYFLTVFEDSRILELTLATIFRPHNSYCIHIDKKADEMFKRTIFQLIKCYQSKVLHNSILSLTGKTKSSFSSLAVTSPSQQTVLRSTGLTHQYWRLSSSVSRIFSTTTSPGTTP